MYPEIVGKITKNTDDASLKITLKNKHGKFTTNDDN